MADYRLRLDIDAFLARHWQKEPLFIPQGLPDFVIPADADELAGLAMESDADSRIVTTDGNHWHQEHGPFTAEQFQRNDRWSLLVQSVDQYWDDAAALLRSVDFLPTWRLDDIMMSYASDGGSAGPHYDNYDVFIIQGEGQRRWQIGGPCHSGSSLMDNTDLRLLADFQMQHEYLMSTGDVLYIPPGIAHFGVSVGESTSFSIGFRAPRYSDLLARWADNLLDTVEDDALFADPERERARGAGEISTRDLERAQSHLLHLLENADPRWFGETVTQVGVLEHSAEDNSLDIKTAGNRISRTPGSRMAWQRFDRELLVYAQGNSHMAPVELKSVLEALCRSEDLVVGDILKMHDAAADLLTWLNDEGAVVFYDG